MAEMGSRNEGGELRSARGQPTGERILVDGRALDELLEDAARSSPREILRTATRAITYLLGQRGSCILLGRHPRVVFALHRPAVSDLPIDLQRYPEVLAAAQTCDLVAVTDARGDAMLASVRAHLPEDLRSVFAVPLVVRRRCLGVVLVQSSRAEQVDDVARATASLLARTAALLVLPQLEHDAETTGAETRDLSGSAGVGSPVGEGRVLVVEDDAPTAQALAGALLEEGYRVDVATDGQQCLRRALEEVPDLILLDVHLPGMSGFEAAASLRRASSTRGVPILFLSGTEDLPTRVRDIQLEHVDFMPKPFSLDELLARIDQALGHSHARRQLLRAAEHDELTGLGNLRMLHRSMVLERSRFARYGHPLAVAMIDVDKLKAINDTFGHVVGSELLREIGKVLRRQARDTDLIVRYGGDEFVALLPHTGLADARVFGKRVSLEIAALTHKGIQTTVSVGVAALTRPRSGESNDDFLRRADRAAYRAKQAGGNRVFVDDEEPAT